MDDQNKTNQALDQSTSFGSVPPTPPVVNSQPIEDITPVGEAPVLTPLAEAPKTTFTTSVSTPTVEPQFVSPLVSSQPNTSTTFTTTVSTPATEPSYSPPEMTPMDTTAAETPSLPTPPEEPEIEMPAGKSKSKILPIVGGIVALFLVLGVAGAAYYVSNQLSTKQAVAPNAPTSKPAATTPALNPLLGNGRDGACNVSTGSAVLNTGSCSGKTTADAVNFVSTANTPAGATSIILLTPPTGLVAGDEVLIINLQGSTSDYANVGQYEFHTIAAISEDNTLDFTSPLINSYNGSSQKIMVQRVPNYTSVTVASGATLTASAWDGTKGGVLAFRANGTVNVSGTISMTGKGYRGRSGGIGYGGESFCGYNNGNSVYHAAGTAGTCGGGGGGYGWNDQYGGAGGSTTGGAGGGGGGANGGTGGSPVAGAGGGGGYGTFGYGGSGHGTAGGSSYGVNGGTNTSGAGGRGWYYPGWEGHVDQAAPRGGGGGGGGTYGDANLTKMYFGSAGGQRGSASTTTLGIGGAGGGILIIYARNLTVSGTVQNNGANGADEGGAGAGGSLYIASNTQSAAANLITVSGGTGPGGAGGSGRLVNISTPAPTTTVTVTTSITPSVTTENGACTLINVYKKVDGVWGTTPLTTAELQQLKTGDVLKFSLVSATDLSE